MHTVTRMNFEGITLSQRNQSQKVCQLCESIYVTSLEKAKLEDWKTDQWFPGVGVEEDFVHEASVWGNWLLAAMEFSVTQGGGAYTNLHICDNS